ncbi:MAG: uroporphyrinogen-III C-methyltransferase [Desulfurococcaceae archaeon]
MSKALGKVYIVGAGPGDPGLITVKGLRILRRGDVVIYDRLVNPELLKHAIKAKEMICAGKKGGKAHLQGEINRLMIERARQGLTIVRLKGGDPMLYGRVGEECQALREAGVPYEVVPGVSAFQAAAAYSEIYVTQRRYSSSISIATGHEEEGRKKGRVNLVLLAKASDTLIIFMGISRLEEIVGELLGGGLDPRTPIAIVQRASLKGQLVVRGSLSNIAQKAARAGLEPPAVIFVGKAVEYMPRRSWFKCRRAK